MIEDRSNEVYYSVASIWEVAIKHKIHPENMPISEEDFVTFCNDMGFSLLEIQPAHIFNIKSLVRLEGSPAHHDPFDRMLIAQAKTDNLKFFTHDTLLSDYDESCIVKV